MSKIVCTQCHSEKDAKEFYRSYSDMYGGLRKLPLCKTCLEKRFVKLLNLYQGNTKGAFKHLMLNLDVYYSEDLFTELFDEDENKLIERYFGALNKSKDKTKTSENNIDKLSETDVKLTKEVPYDLIVRWGRGREEDEYFLLQAKYDEYSQSYPSDELQEKVIIRDICELEMERELYRRDKNPNAYTKIMQEISRKMGELDVIPSKRKSYGEDKNMIVGKLIEEIENKEPIPNTHKEFEDVDGFMKMLNRYFIKPLRKALGLDKTNYTYEDECDNDE